MNQRYLYLCGMIAPILFILMTILGGALRPGYSHLSETISELFSPGSPNKPLLDTLHTTFAVLLTLFGVGILKFVSSSGKSSPAGMIGAWLYIAMGLVSITTAAIFPQDPWGSTPTFAGQMHNNLSGVVGILSVLAMLLLGIWFYRTGLSRGLAIYSFVTIGLAVLTTGFYIASMDGPIMGLAERMAALVGFLWTFVVARWMFVREGNQVTSQQDNQAIR